MKTFYVYILKCKDNSFYTGFTSNLEKRINEHNQGIHPESYTFKRRPVELVWFGMFTDSNHAIAIEKQIKGWSRRKKQAIIDADWDKLVLYSKNYSQFGQDGTSTSSV
jgi:putative endonuclease